MNKPTKVGVVGCGYWGPNLIRNFQSFADCRMSDVCDLNEARLKHMKSLYPDVNAHTSFDEFLKAELDAVVIATPVRFHHKLALRCLQAGKHVLIEKPMAASVKECIELSDVARDKGLVLMVGHTFLFSSSVRRMKEIVDSGDIGNVLYISSRRLNLGLFQKDINVVWDLAPHDLSIIHYLMDETASAVNCQGNCNVTPGIEDVCNTTLSFRSGRVATIQTSWLDPRKTREMTIVGSKKMIVYDDLEPMYKIRIYDQRVEKPPHYDSFAEFQYAYHHGDIYAPHVKQAEPLKVECRHFLDCIESGATPFTSAAQGVGIVRVLESASESLRRNGAQVEISL